MNRVLIVHNFYRQRGGEDAVVEAEAEMLRARGHTVDLFTRHNDDIAGSWDVAREIVWSMRTVAAIRGRVLSFLPDLVHVHNTFPLVSPSVYWALGEVGVPVVQTLHNFRLICPQAMLLREGRVCEDCVGRLPWRAVTRACYRGSEGQSAGVAAMLMAHRAIGTFRKKIQRFIALNEFCRRKFVLGGIPEEKLMVKPNFVWRPTASRQERDSEFLYVGRLSEEKGIVTLARAFGMFAKARLRVIGEGPEEEQLRLLPNAVRVGYGDAAMVASAMQRAFALVLPSVWYENFPRTLVEAFACGLPVIASRIGSLAELVEDGVTGLLFEPGSADDLSKKLRWAAAHPEAMRRMGESAYAVYEQLYTPEVNYQQLMNIYTEAIRDAG